MNHRFFTYGVIALSILFISCVNRNNEELSLEPFTFVQMCDPQLGMGGYEHDVESFQLAVEQINELGPDFVAICGDLVHHATDSAFEDFLEIVELFEMPCHLAPGNHDVGNTPDLATLEYYRKTMGEDYFHFQHKGYAFIVANTQLWKVNVEHESEKHDTWFKETLALQVNENLPVIVIGHHPMFIGQPEEEEEYFNIPPAKRAELLDLYVENNVVAYLSGHKHNTVINNYKGIQLVTGETTSKNFDKRPLGFRHWEVAADTVIQHFVALKSIPVEQPDEVVH